MTTTTTGKFIIALRQGRSAWQKDVARLATWAAGAGFGGIDVMGRFTPAHAAALSTAGLRLGTVDLLDFARLTTPDPGARRELVAQNVAYIKECAAAGARLFFSIVPGERDRTRLENYRLAVESFATLAQAAADAGAKIVIEGYPGAAPHYALLCCTPETCRTFLKDLNSPGVGLNYDPSHLIRLGIDPIRFLCEFIPNIQYVHAKDTQLYSDAVYEYGLYQEAAFAKPHGYGQHVWRYTIPGRGVMRWADAFDILKKAGYAGMVSVELEDEDFNGSEVGEAAGLVEALRFLQRT